MTLQQWYHQYGEAGTQQAVQKYAAAYPDAKVKVQWSPGDYDKKAASALLTGSGPDVFEYGNGPTVDMILGKQVVDLGDILGDAKADFTPALLERMTYQGKLYAVPQVIDMQLLVYRKCMLAEGRRAAAPDGRRAHRRREEADHQATSRACSSATTAASGVLGGPMLWSAGLDYLTKDNTFGFDDPAAAEALGKLRELCHQRSLLLGAPNDWFDPSAISQGLTAMQWTGLWTFPDLKKDLGDDFGVLPWPALDGTGAPSVPVGAYGSCVSAKSQNVDAAKKFVKWLWVDQTDDQLDFATVLRLPHPVAHEPRRPRRRRSRAAPPPTRRKLVNRERPRAVAAAVDPQVRHSVLATR